jgi:hypothetical protein
MNDKKADVRIHIDCEPCTSPNPTTGKALYRLSKKALENETFSRASYLGCGDRI